MDDDRTASIVAEHGEVAVLRDLSSFRTLLSDGEYRTVAHHLADEHLLAPRSASSYAQNTHLSTGVAIVDLALGGGLPMTPGGHLVELHGAAGCGKTQLCLHICARADVASVYVCTAGRFPSQRYAQLADERRQSTTVVEHVRDVETLEEWVAHRLPWLLRQSGARIVVIDSIAAIYRPTFQRGSELERAASMRKVTLALKAATAAVEGVVLVVNEISSRPDALPHKSSVPALGRTWGSCCNTRLEISRLREGNRRVRVMHSSVVASGTEACFAINEHGLESVES